MALLVLVEDEPDHVVILSSLLRRAGHEVRVAGDGAAALDLVRTECPDLVVLDLSLPGPLCGFDVCRRLRADPRTAALPVVIVTGWASENEVAAGFAAGADDYLIKPFDRTVVGDRIRALLDRVASGHLSRTGVLAREKTSASMVPVAAIDSGVRPAHRSRHGGDRLRRGIGWPSTGVDLLDQSC